jgi:hypothetical protein
MTDIAAYFDRYGWTYETPDANLWQSTFFTESEEEFDLYVMLVEDWVHFAVTPFLPPIPDAQASRVHTVMLKLNQKMRIVRFALDGDGDASLIADAPAPQLNDAYFAQIVEAFVYYADRLAGELRRMAVDDAYASPLIQE